MLTAANAVATPAAAFGYWATSSDPPATVSKPAARLKALMITVFDLIQLFIRTPHDEANAQSCVRFSQECISETSGDDIMPGMRLVVNAT